MRGLVSPVPVAPGATRFELSADAELSVFVAAPKPGRTVDEVNAAVKTSPDNSFEVADIVASAALAPGVTRSVTAEIKANTSYVLVNDAGKENPAEWVFTPLATAGAPTGATAPEPDAEVLMRDLRFAGHRTLPRSGTVRARNIGWAPHFTIAAPLKRGARPGAVARALLSGRERQLARVLQLRNSVEVSSILTRGASADYEVEFAKRGRHVLVCFFEGHNAQGMFRFVRVR